MAEAKMARALKVARQAQEHAATLQAKLAAVQGHGSDATSTTAAAGSSTSASHARRATTAGAAAAPAAVGPTARQMPRQLRSLYERMMGPPPKPPSPRRQVVPAFPQPPVGKPAARAQPVGEATVPALGSGPSRDTGPRAASSNTGAEEACRPAMSIYERMRQAKQSTAPPATTSGVAGDDDEHEI